LWEKDIGNDKCFSIILSEFTEREEFLGRKAL